MANPMYGQNKFDNSADAIVGEKGRTYVQRNVINITSVTAETDLTLCYFVFEVSNRLRVKRLKITSSSTSFLSK